MIANTPKPPYYLVVFSSIKNPEEADGYDEMANRMFALAIKQPGFLGVESARNELGITVSYWKNLESIKKWKEHAGHAEARKKGREKWYAQFKVRIAKVERDYGTEP